jgi:phospholipid-binding lipoprotein MlaA
LRLFITYLFTLTLLFASNAAAQSAQTEDFEAEFSQKNHEALFDPLSGYNTLMTSFNDSFYEYLLKPTAKGYAYVVPQMARNGISNFFDNLFFPIRFVNNLLQFKFYNAWEETERFALNSTMGILGFRDVAGEELGIQAHDEDFGQTLGSYGVGSGFHIVLPILGPSNVRDVVGLVGDYWLNPLSYIEARDANMVDNTDESLEVTAFHTINRTSLHYQEYDSLKKDAIELYPFLRDVYESRRNKLIKE